MKINKTVTAVALAVVLAVTIAPFVFMTMADDGQTKKLSETNDRGKASKGGIGRYSLIPR